MTGIMQMIASHKVPTISGVTYANMVFNLDAAGYGALPGNVITTSASFNGSTQYLTLPASTVWALGTADFTIEWWQYQTGAGTFPRVFSVGANPASIAVSIEGGTFYFWENGNFTFSSVLSSYLTTWVHFAISRVSGQTSVYQNGTKLGSTFSDTNNINDSSSTLSIGREISAFDTYFPGYISNFRIIKGTGIYTANFSPITTTLRPIAGTQLLLPLVATPFTDISTNEFTVTNVGTVTTTASAPTLTAITTDLTGTYPMTRTGASISWKSTGTGGYFEKNNATGTDHITGGPNYAISQSYTVFMAYQGDSRSGGRLLNTASEAVSDWVAGTYTSGTLYKNVFYPNGTVNLNSDSYVGNSGWNFLWGLYDTTTGWGNLYIASSTVANVSGPSSVYKFVNVGTGNTHGFNQFRLWSRSGGAEVQTGNIGLVRVYDGVMPLAQIQSTWANLHTRFGI